MSFHFLSKQMQFHIDFISARGAIFSKNLSRWVKFRFVAPANYWKSETAFPVLLMNDGQDFGPMGIEQTLTKAFAKKTIRPFVYLGIECNEDRMQEYGIASSADFKGNEADESFIVFYELSECFKSLFFKVFTSSRSSLLLLYKDSELTCWQYRIISSKSSSIRILYYRHVI